jgi:hypothetical protein
MIRYLKPGALARPDRAINHVIAYGQSLSTGWEGWPALSTTPQFDLLMLGDSVRGAHEHASIWSPVGAARFTPLAATNQGIDGALLHPSDVSILPPNALVLGETVLESALREWRARLRTAAPPRRLLASAVGVGGRSLEALSKGAGPELFNRLRDCARIARDTASGDYRIAALLMLQGENNAWALHGATADTATYKALFTRFVADFNADIAGAIAGQTTPPAVFTYQTGGAYSSDDLGIAQAQLDLALEHSQVFMVGPVYPVTDKGGHLDANGYRWLGAQFGRVMHRVITLGEDWQPLHPTSVHLSGDTIHIAFHVPVPPLAWGRPYLGHAAQWWDDRGFTVVDAGGHVAITAIVLGETNVTLRLARPPGPGAELRYADRSLHHGTGNLHDSEAAVSLSSYEYNATTGHRPEANIPNLIDKPYPLMNWCVAFRATLVPGA